jgi:hypothetical protein
MSDIDDLCAIIHRGIGLNFEDLADEIIAAGFHRDRTIDTVEELGELPDESVVLGIDHSLWHREGCWWDQEGHPASSNPVIAEHGPVTVLHEVARDE